MTDAPVSSSATPHDERDCSGGFIATSLHKGALHDQPELVERALECTATNVNAVDAEGRTAVMIAAIRGHRRVCQALCDAGADLEATDGDNLDAATLADLNGHLKCGELLRAAMAKRKEIERLFHGLPKAESVSSAHDEMAKLLAAAGLPKVPAESPF